MYQNLTDNTLGRNCNKFSLDILTNAFKENNEVFTSVSTYMALVLSLVSSAGNNKKQLLAALHSEDNDDDKLLQDYKKLEKIINFADNKDNIEIKSIGSIYVDNKYNLNDNISKEIKKFRELQTVDFSDMDKQIVDINTFVSNETKGEVENILSDIKLGDNMMSLIAVSLYLGASWVDRFEVDKTTQKEFVDLDGNTKTLDFMTQIEYFPYMETDHVQVLRMNVCSQEYSLMCVLPKDENYLVPSFDDYEKYCSGCLYKSVMVTIPKFKQMGRNDMNNNLAELGVINLFEVDYSENIQNELRINNVVESVVFEINENGLGSGAVANGSEIIEFERKYDVEFCAKKAFSYFVMHNESGVILISGVYNG